MAGETNPRPFLLLGGIFATVGLGVLGFGVVQLVEAARSSSWPTTPGVIAESRVVEKRGMAEGQPTTSHHARISYRYEVDGRSYTADRIAIARVDTSGPDDERRLVRRYPIDRPVTVSYDPDDPGSAVLEPGVGASNAFLPAMGGLFAAIGLGLLVAWARAIRARRAEDRQADERADTAGVPMADLATIPDPPPGLGLRLSRRADSLTFSGMTSPGSAGGGASTGAVVPGLLVGAFAGFWTLACWLMLVVGVVFCGGLLVLTLRSDQPFMFNDRPVGKPAAAAFLIGFGIAWVAISAFMIRGSGPLRTISALASGKAVAFPWTLRLDGRRLTATTKVLDEPVERRVHLAEVRGLGVDAEGNLVARRESDPAEVELVGPLDPRAAGWLADTLSRAIGPAA